MLPRFIAAIFSIVAISCVGVGCAEQRAQRALDDHDAQRSALVAEVEAAKAADDQMWGLAEMGMAVLGTIVPTAGVVGGIGLKAARKAKSQGLADGARTVVDSIAQARKEDPTINAAFEGMDPKVKKVVGAVLAAVPEVAAVVETRTRR